MHIWDPGGQDSVFARLVVKAPVKAGPVLVVSIPRFGDVNLTICRPGEGLLGEEPECRPYALGTRRENDGRKYSAISRQSRPAD